MIFAVIYLFDRLGILNTIFQRVLHIEQRSKRNLTKNWNKNQNMRLHSLHAHSPHSCEQHMHHSWRNTRNHQQLGKYFFVDPCCYNKMREILPSLLIPWGDIFYTDGDINILSSFCVTLSLQPAGKFQSCP